MLIPKVTSFSKVYYFQRNVRIDSYSNHTSTKADANFRYQVTIVTWQSCQLKRENQNMFSAIFTLTPNHITGGFLALLIPPTLFSYSLTTRPTSLNSCVSFSRQLQRTPSRSAVTDNHHVITVYYYNYYYTQTTR